MKKFLSLILSLSLTLSLAACGSSDDGNNGGSDPADALEVLDTVWNGIADDQKFDVGGGDADNMTDGAPGRYSVEDGEALYYSLAFPAESVSLIDDAASLMHMMNANSFTAGAYHLTDSADADTLASALKDSIANRQWMCGFPDKFIVVTLGSFVVSCYGLEDNVNNFRDSLTTAYADAVIVCDEAIA